MAALLLLSSHQVDVRHQEGHGDLVIGVRRSLTEIKNGISPRFYEVIKKYLVHIPSLVYYILMILK